jgi:hypothetical protein
MKINIPNFSYGPRDAKKNYVIELEGEVIHRIENMEEFFAALGYSPEISKEGILPDEFIWERFVRDAEAKCRQCLNFHIFRYLHQHSVRFNELYQANLEQWPAILAMSNLCGQAHCKACKINQTEVDIASLTADKTN